MVKAAEARARQDRAIVRDAVGPIALACPLAIAARFGSFRHCMEAAVCGSRLIREYGQGLETRILPCAVRAWDTGTTYLTAGYSLAEMKAIAGREPTVLLGGNDEHAFHVVIEVRRGTARTIVDLTAGQIIPNELTLVLPWQEGWPRVTAGEWTIEYDDSPRAPAIEEGIAKAEQVEYAALMADMRDAAALAKMSGSDRAAFYKELQRQVPESFESFLNVVEQTRDQFKPS